MPKHIHPNQRIELERLGEFETNHIFENKWEGGAFGRRLKCETEEVALSLSFALR